MTRKEIALALRQRIDARLAELGRTAREVSIEATGKEHAIRIIGTGDTGKMPSGATLEALARALRTTSTALLGLDAAPAAGPGAQVHERPLGYNARELPRDVPVMGTTAGHSHQPDNIDELFTLHGGEPVDYVRRPPAITGKRDVYALFVVGTSMEPRYREGALIYVDPHTPPRIGDDVVVQLRTLDGRVNGSIIKTLIRRTADKLLLEQYAPASTLEIAREQVLALHRVLPWEELLSL